MITKNHDILKLLAAVDTKLADIQDTITSKALFVPAHGMRNKLFSQIANNEEQLMHLLDLSGSLCTSAYNLATLVAFDSSQNLLYAKYLRKNFNHSQILVAATRTAKFWNSNYADPFDADDRSDMKFLGFFQEFARDIEIQMYSTNLRFRHIVGQDWLADSDIKYDDHNIDNDGEYDTLLQHYMTSLIFIDEQEDDDDIHY